MISDYRGESGTAIWPDIQVVDSRIRDRVTGKEYLRVMIKTTLRVMDTEGVWRKALLVDRKDISNKELQYIGEVEYMGNILGAFIEEVYALQTLEKVDGRDMSTDEAGQKKILWMKDDDQRSEKERLMSSLKFVP